MRLKRFILPFMLISGILFSTVLAQNPKSATPYKIGESLTYEGKFSKSILRGIAVADLNFTVSDLSKSGDYFVKAEAKSKGTLLKIFNFKFYQRIESTIDDEQQNILK